MRPEIAVPVGISIICLALIGIWAGLPGGPISKWLADSPGLTIYWCGLTIKDTNDQPIANLAVHVSSTELVYTTNPQGFTKIWNSGFTDGCPGGIQNIGITASVFYQNTEYAVYLEADQNVTLRV